MLEGIPVITSDDGLSISAGRFGIHASLPQVLGKRSALHFRINFITLDISCGPPCAFTEFLLSGILRNLRCLLARGNLPLIFSSLLQALLTFLENLINFLAHVAYRAKYMGNHIVERIDCVVFFNAKIFNGLRVESMAIAEGSGSICDVGGHLFVVIYTKIFVKSWFEMNLTTPPTVLLSYSTWW